MAATTRTFLVLLACALSGCVGIGEGARAPDRIEFEAGPRQAGQPFPYPQASAWSAQVTAPSRGD